MSPPPDSAFSRKRQRILRWLLRLGVVVVTLILVLIVTVQIVLWTNTPERIAIAQIQNVLGARAKIDSLAISWTGHTKLRGLTLTLPLADAPVVKVDEVLVEHAFLPFLVFTQRVNRITVNGADIDVREDSTGKWNVQQLLPVTGQNTAEPLSTPDIPNLVVRNARLTITRADGRHGEVDGINLSGKKSGPLEYDIAAAVGESVNASGQVSLARDLHHHLTLDVKGIPEGIKELTGKLPSPLLAALEWSGRTSPSGVEGSLTIVSAQLGQATAKGHANISTTAEKTLLIAPSNLLLTIPQGGVGAVTLESGKIHLGDKIRIDQLHARLEQGSVALQGELDPTNFTGDLTAAWQQVQQKGFNTTGTATMHIGREMTGEFSGNAVFTGSLETPGGSANASITVSGKGRSLEEFGGTIISDPFTWQPVSGEPIAVPALAGHVNGRGSRIVLDSLRPRDTQAGEFLATAEFDRNSHQWWASLHTRELDVSQFRVRGLKLPLDVNLNADGTLSRVDIRQLFLRQGKTVVYITGFYDGTLPTPVELDTWCWYTPTKESEDDASFQGLVAHGQVQGTLNPRALGGKGIINANNLVLRDHVIGDVALDLNAQMTDWHATFSTAEMQLLEGEWQMQGEWTAFTDRPPHVMVTWKDLSLPAIGDVAKVGGLEGKLDKGTAVFTVPSLRLRDWTMKASVEASDLKLQGLAVDTLNIDATLDHGSIIVKPVLKRGDGALNAQINASLATDQPIKLLADINHWPAPSLSTRPWATDLSASISGKLEASYLIPVKELNAQTQLSGTIERAGEPVGNLALSASLANSRLLIDKIHVETLNGTADVNATVDLKNLETLRLDFIFNKLKPSQLTWISPVLEDVVGDYTGSLRIAPSTGERPLGPVRIDFTLAPEAGGFKTVEISETKVTAYAAYKSPYDWRLVTDEAVINVAGGKIKPFARISRSPGRSPTQLLTAEIAAVQLSPIVRAYKDDKKEIVGEVTGEARVFGSTTSIKSLTAEADVRLTNSDLGNFGPVAAMYNILHIGGDIQPNGRGHLSLRMEAGNINVTSAVYFNRGAYINGFGTVSDVTEFPDSPLDLTLFGSLRPLRDINLPFFADADKLFSVVQAAGTTIHAGGTIHDPEPKQVAFQELGETVRGVLLGKIKQDKEQQ